MAIRTYLITALICCTATQSVAESDSQSLASIEARRQSARTAVVACIERHIDAHVKSSDEAKYLWSAARGSCAAECKKSNGAEVDLREYNNRHDQLYYSNSDYRRASDKMVALALEGCAGDPITTTLEYADSALKKKREQEIEAREPVLLEAMKAKLIPALDCNAKYSTLFALATTETPENIATAAFNKCSQLFEDAAAARIDPSYGTYWHNDIRLN
jgi:hypothetical protein